MRYPLPPAPLALLVLILMALAPAALLPRLEINNAPEIYFPSSAAAVEFERELRERFPEDQVIVAMFEPPDPYADEFIARMEALATELQRHPRVERVISPMTLDRISGSEDGFIVEPLLSGETAAALTPQERRQRVLADRFAPGLLVSRDGDALAMIVRPRELEDSFDRRALTDAFHEAVDDAGMTDHLTAVSGIVPLEVAQLRSMLRDSMVFIPITLALGLGLIAWLFRRVLAIAVAVLAFAAIINSTLALLVLAGWPYTMVSAILPPLMLALTVALLIHWYNALAHAAARGLAGRERVMHALAGISSPAIYTSITTAAGLLSLTFSPVRPVAAFGMVGAAGMLILCFVVLVLLPPLFMHDRRPWGTGGAGLRAMDRVVSRLRMIGMRRPVPVLAGASLLVLVAAVLASRVEVETDLFRFFGPEHPITVSTERIQERLSGVTTLELVLDTERRDAFMDPARLADVKALQDWVASLPAVDRTMSMVDLIEEMHWGFHGEDSRYRALPLSAELIAQYLLIYDGADLHDLVDRDFQRTRILLNLDVHGARAINDVIDTIAHRLQADPPGDFTVTAAGFGRLFGDQEALLIEGQVKGLIAAVFLIFALMALQWRSVRSSALCMVPNLAPVLLIFGLMGALGIWLDMATAMIASVTVGIAVDDTIHLYHGYRHRVAAGVNPVWALARSYQYAGRAVTATTLILVPQFLLLATSQFVPTMEFGLLTALGLLVALVFDLLVLPAMLVLLRKQRRTPATVD